VADRYIHDQQMDKVVEHQMSQWELSHSAEEKSEEQAHLAGETEIRYITISQQLGSGGEQIAQILSELLKWQIYDHEILDYMAENMDVHVKTLESVDERTISWINDWLAPLFSSKSGEHVEQMSYYKHLGKVLLVIAKHGRAIIIGRSAGQILPREKGLSVRVVAPFELRCSHYAKENNISIEEATALVKASDKRQAGFMKELLQKDIDDPVWYDIVINMEKLAPKSVAKLIWRALEQRIVSRQEQVKVNAEGEDITLIVERQMQQWEKERSEPDKQTPFEFPHLAGGAEIEYITIGRLVGAGGVEVARILSDRMNWQLYDREILEYMSKNMKVHVRLLTSLDERTVGWIGDRLVPFLARKTREDHVKQIRYFQHLGEVLLALAKHGRAIILGRGSGLILPREKGLSVFVMAPFELRCKRYAGEKKIGLEEATSFMTKSDRHLRRFIKDFLGKNLCNPLDYDIVFNTEKIYPTSVTKLILRTLDERLASDREQSDVPPPD
jgi:cytidylate kinase